MKLKWTVVFEIEVGDLKHYNADTLQEAAQNQKQVIEEGLMSLDDCIAFGNILSYDIEPVEE